MNDSIDSGRNPFLFFLLAFLLAVPLWVLGALVGNISSLKIPVTDLGLAFIPFAAAAILLYREQGLAGVKLLLNRIFGFKLISKKDWYIPLFLLPLVIYLLVLLVMYLAGNSIVIGTNLLRYGFLLIIFFILAIGEEAGWMGYAIDPLQNRWGALKASIILAIPWYLGHFPSIIQIGGTVADLAWWLPGAIGLRILIVWLYNNTGKNLFTSIIFHAMINLGRIITYPAVNSHYVRHYQAVGYTIIALMALIISLLWDSKTLTRFRFAGLISPNKQNAR